LNVRDNRIEALPYTVGQMSSLLSLYAQGNKLQWLPPELGTNFLGTERTRGRLKLTTHDPQKIPHG
jgi:Leucine-rich repeat (LRR) protein